MTVLYALNLGQIPSSDWETLIGKLPPQRQQRIHDCRRENDQNRIAGAGLLLQLALEQADIPAPRQIFSETPAGKPFLPDFPHVHFSLSHSGTWAVCAVSDTAVGVDVEPPRCSSAVARRHFHPQEQNYADDPDALCRIWTAKEAFVKALGTGLTIPLNSFLVRLSEEGAVLEQQLTPTPYRLHEYSLPPYRICLCTADDRPELQLVGIKNLLT